MKKYLVLLLLFLVIACATAEAMDPVEAPQSCQQCRMDRTLFAHSRTLVVYTDGTTAGLCSINCAVADMKSKKDKPVKSLLVADYSTKKLIDANTAIWVVGGKKRGVMTALPKWAFADKQAAQEFMEEYGGEITPFAQVRKLTEKEVAEMAEMLKEIN
jgi:nitrous oxide reductase accessory protein NosL